MCMYISHYVHSKMVKDVFICVIDILASQLIVCCTSSLLLLCSPSALSPACCPPHHIHESLGPCGVIKANGSAGKGEFEVIFLPCWSILSPVFGSSAGRQGAGRSMANRGVGEILSLVYRLLEDFTEYEM